MYYQLFTANKQTDINFNSAASGFPDPSIFFSQHLQNLTRRDGQPESFRGFLPPTNASNFFEYFVAGPIIRACSDKKLHEVT